MCCAIAMGLKKIDFGKVATQFFKDFKTPPPPLPQVTASIPGAPLGSMFSVRLEG
jgi:hypothetical protein